MGYKAVGIVPDCHIPFEDLKAYSLMLKVFKHIEQTQGLEAIYLLGDFVDFYGVSLYDKDPSFGDLSILYDREIECANTRLDQLDEMFPESKKVYIEGNHEVRLKKYINKFAGPLRNRINIVNELRINERPKWQWVSYDKLQAVQVLGSPLYARHEPYGSAQPSKQAEKAGSSFIYGHTHQIGSGMFTHKLNGCEVHAINSGCLIDMKAKVFNYVKDRPNWKHAFTIVWCNKKDFHYQVINITKDYNCIFDGKVFRSNET